MSDMENRENVNHYLTDLEKNDSDIVVIGSNIPQELVLASGKIPYWILGGSGWRRLQPFQYGKPCFAAGCGNRCAFKENEKRNTGCGQVVPAGFLCIVDGHAVFPDGEILVIL